MRSQQGELMIATYEASCKMPVEVWMLSGTFSFSQKALAQDVYESLKAHLISLGSSSAFPVVCL